MLRAAIVGFGRWGQHLVQCAQGSNRIRFVGAVVRDPRRASKELSTYTSYEEALADADIDAVVLATPHSVHAEQILQAARAKKHVFTEKPFTLTRRSAEEAVRACAQAGVTLAVGYNWRFQPALQEIRRMLQDGRLGKLLHMEGNFCGPSAYRYGGEHWRQSREEGPAGGMTGRGVHVVDAMLYLGGKIAGVQAQSVRRAQETGIDDTTSMLFRFSSGATGYLGTVIATAETWRLQVFGARGWAEVGGIGHLDTWRLRYSLVNQANPFAEGQVETMAFPALSTERAELEHFAEAALARRPLAVAGGDEIHGVAVLEAIVDSANRAATVRIEP
ncbi:MAG TPA: Gfo/Idh/MocA family oxidoreductase [Burkholderiales bacterium]